MDDALIQAVNGYFSFGNHPLADRWMGYSEGARMGAIRHAVRQFSDALRHSPDLEQERWQRAIAEQALALLILGRVAQGPGESDAWVLQSQAGAVNDATLPEVEMAGPFALSALRAAGWSGHVTLRG